MTVHKNYAAAVRSLLLKVQKLPVSVAKLDLLEEAVRLADSHQDIGLGFAARLPLMETARTMARGEVLATAFAWCLAQHDRDPKRFAGWNLLHAQEGAIGYLGNFPETSRKQLDDMMADYKKRMQTGGFSLRNYYYTERLDGRDLGDRELVRTANQEIRKYPYDSLSHGPMWDLAEQVATELFCGREDEAMRLAEPFIQDQFDARWKSDEVCADLLLPLLKRGRIAQGTHLLTRYRLRTYHPDRGYYTWYVGKLMMFAALTNDLALAVRLCAESQHNIRSFTDTLSRYNFAMDAGVVFDCLAATGKQEIVLRLPKDVPVPHDDGRYSVALLREWLGNEARQLADRFDARNGNSFFREQLLERAELQQWSVPLELRPAIPSSP